MTARERHPLSRNPVAWLLLLIPVATLLAGLWTLRVAAGRSAVDASPDPVRRIAQVQQVALDADEVAAHEGLSARLVLDADGATVQLAPAPDTVAPVLRLVHPIEADADRVLDFAPSPQGWRTQGELPRDVAWHLRLQSADGRWRLVGRYRPGDAAVELAPAVAAP